MFGQNSFARNQPGKVKKDDTETQKQVRFQQSPLATQPPSFSNPIGDFRAFGSPATFVTPSTIAPYTGSHFIEIPSTFGARQQPAAKSSIFGSAFQSPSMSTIASSTPTTTQQQPPSSPVSYSFTAAAARLASSADQQPSGWSSSFGTHTGFVHSSAPIFPAGFTSQKNSGANASSSAAAWLTPKLGSGTFGQKFGQPKPAPTKSVPKPVAGPSAHKHPDDAGSTKNKEGSSHRGVRTESAEHRGGRGSSTRMTDRRKLQESVRKPVIQRKGPLFYRALAGIAKTEHRTRARLPSRDDTYPESRARHLSEKNSSKSTTLTDPNALPSESTKISSEIAKLKSIICKGIPIELNNKTALQEHFGKFGVVTRIYCNPQKELAIVHFLDHASAALAKSSGTVLKPGSEPVLIFWSKAIPSSRTRSQSTTSTPVSNVQKESPRSSKKYLDQSEVNAELEAMGQTQTIDAPKILDRPKELPKKAKKKRDALKIPDSTEELLKLSAHTSEERYRLLDARDKFLRLGVKKQSDLAMAKATIGTCRDMCPEKERYMRAHRNQLHPYEMDVDGHSINHSRVVKEYSRSSADQEEPLPHELRSIGVLSMTMDYLICNVMDLHERERSSTEEWYDFVWNRTRAIRKDVTQQHLCDTGAVLVVERCARFHIHCAERLCEEHMATFDQRINNENLTNCLQMLKHFYEDLKMKDEHCMNESEFRAYDVLLNLNEGDILRQVHLLDLPVRDSPLVAQALAFYVALNSNNYVRFFKLVRSTSYLNACIAQRYFTQVRLKALLTILRAYSPPNHSGTFPIAKLVNILAFEDEEDAREFLEHYSLAIENGHVILDRSTFYQPENPAPLKRSLKIIESKRTCSVGEIIYGGPLPPNPLQYYTPSSSFNEHGMLQKEIVTEPDRANAVAPQKMDSLQEVATMGSPLRSNSPLVRKTAAEEERARCFELAESVANSLLAESVQSLVQSTVSTELHKLQFMRRHVLEIVAAILDSVCISSLRALTDQVYKEEIQAELKARRLQEEAKLERKRHIARMKEECASEVVDSVTRQVINMEVRDVAAEIFENEKEVARKLRNERVSHELHLYFSEIWIVDILWDICTTIHNEQLKLRQEILSRVSQKLNVWRSHAFFQKWWKYVEKRKHMRHSMELFPSCCLGLRSNSTMGKPWTGARSTGLVSPIQVAENRRCNEKHLDMNLLSCNIQNSFSNLYIDLPSLATDFVPYIHSLRVTQRHAPVPPLQNLYWKVLLSIASISQDQTGLLTTVIQWLKVKLNQPLSCWHEGTSQIEVFKMTVEEKSHGHIPYFTAICFKALQGNVRPDNTHSNGAQGIFHVMQLFEDSQVLDLGFWAQERIRLVSLLKSKPCNPPLPVVIAILVHESHPASDALGRQIEIALGIRDLMDNGSIADFLIVPFSANFLEPASTETLLHSLQWLSQHCPEPPNLRMQSFSQFLSDEINKYFSTLAYQDLRSDSRCFHQCPEVLIGAYNHALEHAAAVVSDKSLKNISWPPMEFAEKYFDLPSKSWNTDETFQQLRSLVATFRLPLFPTDVKKCLDWHDITEAVWDYMGYTDSSDDWASKITLASRIQKILDQSRALYQNDNEKSAPFEAVPWTDLIHAFIDYNLQSAPNNLVVTYDPEMAEASFKPFKEWNMATVRRTTMHWQQDKHSSNLSIAKTMLDVSTKIAKRKQEFVGEDIANSLKRRVVQDPFRDGCKHEELQKSCSELLRQLHIEKQRAAEFDELLKNALEEEISIQDAHTTSF